MERLKKMRELLDSAMATLEDSLDVVNQAHATGNPKLVLAAEDSVIQRFEYTYDGFWKYIKRYIELMHNTQNVNSPKAVFHAITKLGLCTEEQGLILIAMSDDRNETSHTYSAESAREVFSDVARYYACIQAVLKNLQ